MSTNQQVVTYSMQEINAIYEGQSPTAAQSTDAMNMMNRMLADWAENDMDMNYPPQDTLTATCPIPLYAEDAVITNLAVRLCPSFEKPVSAELYERADKAKRKLATVLMNLKLEQADMSHLPQGNSKFRYNIETDI